MTRKNLEKILGLTTKMHTGSSRERLQAEIAALIKFITDGREFFFKQTNLSINSSDGYLNWLVCLPLFNQHPELTQTELNIQLFYIKLASYYELIGKNNKEVIKARNAFAHVRTQMIFSKPVKYNLFLHKVSHNFKKVMFVFYEENQTDDEMPNTKALELELDSDIREFVKIWGEYEEKKQADSISKEPTIN